MRSSLAWLQQNGVIDAADLETDRKLTETRNQIAHELAQIMSCGDLPDLVSLFPRLVALVRKIERCWVINLDIATDPDYNGVEIDEESIVTGSAWKLHMLSQAALAEGDEAWVFYRRSMERSEEKE